MERHTVNPEILDEMIGAEIAVKYRCYSQALETLARLAHDHPNYLPAKEALETVYRETGQIELAVGIGKEIELIRSQLANQAAEKTTTVAFELFTDASEILSLFVSHLYPPTSLLWKGNCPAILRALWVTRTAALAVMPVFATFPPGPALSSRKGEACPKTGHSIANA